MTTTAPHLLGGFAPVDTELSVAELPVSGAVPPELTGWYLRNGPNPRTGASPHWFLGDGMVHGVRLEGGRAVAYRNRWVRTATFTGEPREEGGRPDLRVGQANTHVVRHAGRTFALVESSLPYELDMRGGHELDTVGAYDFGGRLRTAMTAHPKICPVTGELHFFGYGVTERPYLTYHRADANGNLVCTRPIEVSAPTMMHDFHLTAGHVVFMDLPVVFDPARIRTGAPGMPYRWQPEYGARLGVLDRADPQGPVRWFEIEPCYVFHGLNAHEDPSGRVLTMQVIRYDRLGDGVDVRNRGSLWSWAIDLTAGTVTERQIDDRDAEFPRIDDRLAGLPARYGHVTSTVSAAWTGADAGLGALHRYDLRSGDATSYMFPGGRSPSEASFAPADDRPGGPGWLLSYVYDPATDRSDLVILDTEDLPAGPVAQIHLPQRVPAGFHGNWLPDDPALAFGEIPPVE